MLRVFLSSRSALPIGNGVCPLNENNFVIFHTHLEEVLLDKAFEKMLLSNKIALVKKTLKQTLKRVNYYQDFFILTFFNFSKTFKRRSETCLNKPFPFPFSFSCCCPLKAIGFVIYFTCS